VDTWPPAEAPEEPALQQHVVEQLGAPCQQQDSAVTGASTMPSEPALQQHVVEQLSAPCQQQEHAVTQASTMPSEPALQQHVVEQLGAPCQQQEHAVTQASIIPAGPALQQPMVWQQVAPCQQQTHAVTQEPIMPAEPALQQHVVGQFDAHCQQQAHAVSQAPTMPVCIGPALQQQHAAAWKQFDADGKFTAPLLQALVEAGVMNVGATQLGAATPIVGWAHAPGATAKSGVPTPPWTQASSAQHAVPDAANEGAVPEHAEEVQDGGGEQVQEGGRAHLPRGVGENAQEGGGTDLPMGRNQEDEEAEQDGGGEQNVVKLEQEDEEAEQDDARAVKTRRGKKSTREASFQESPSDSDSRPAKKKKKRKPNISTRLKPDGRFGSLEAEIRFRRQESLERNVSKMQKRLKRQALNSNDDPSSN